MLASRLHWRLLVGTILVLMAAAWLAPLVARPPELRENRPLAPAPAWPRRPEDLAALRKAADAYVADHFPARPYLIAALNRARMAAGVSGSGRVIVGRDGWLFFDNGSHLGEARGDPPLSAAEARAWLATFAARRAYAAQQGAAYLVVVPPSKETVYPQHGPAWYRGPNPDRPAAALARIAQAGGAGDLLYLYAPVKAAADAGQPVFSRHDTHWTGYGAYAGYAALMDRLHALGLTDGPRPLSAIPMQPSGARGPRDLAAMLGVSSLVSLDAPHFDYAAAVAGKPISYLGPRTDWTAPQVIDTGVAGKPILLLLRDSFSNEMLPLLLPHFSRIVLAHVQDGFWRPDLMARFRPQAVVLEVTEPGLPDALLQGPATAPALRVVDAPTAAIIAGAKATGVCNVETAAFGKVAGGVADFTASGWMTELAPRVTSPLGLVVLKGAGGAFAGDLAMDRPRPDVAAHFRLPSAEASGFAATFAADGLPRGLYTIGVYRRSGPGWIACAARQAVVAP
ncbi:hypothetical protein [Phenylobacterium sp.]|uniref:alginate O-acetyltransferase AlgX-related protein n=1 Tax=Phenylobacterium sp. TaxID=1871053 RepID=UPI0011F9F562|nr:hypothetical protein [Phenylobacterium sp.]THD62707.1 MAG: hypothetical protein E8A49_06900 [Phenylobacterium sp.]